MGALLRLLVLLAAATMAAGCATRAALPQPPRLALAPATLGKALALHQRLTVSTRGQVQQFEVAVEADAEAVRMVVLDLGQPVARFEWDGQSLRQQRAPGWPEAVRGERILDDLQLVQWPLEPLRRALPLGWSLAAGGQGRELRFHAAPVIRVRYPAPDVAEIDNLAEDYRVRIESRRIAAAEGSP
jgi:hypothetical protein